MAKLKCLRNGEVQIGPKVEAIEWTQRGHFSCVKGNHPIVGCSLLVGNDSDHVFSSKDFTLTPEIVEILEDRVIENNVRYVKFTTKSNIYELFID